MFETYIFKSIFHTNYKLFKLLNRIQFKYRNHIDFDFKKDNKSLISKFFMHASLIDNI